MALAAILFCSCDGTGSNDISHQDYAAVRLTEGSAWSIIDTDGNVIADSVFSTEKALTLAYDGAFWVVDERGYQLYNVEHHDKPLTPVYRSATSFRQGRAFVSNGNEPIKMIDTKGNVVATLPGSISRAWEFSPNGLAQCKNGDTYIYVDTHGRKVFTVKAKRTFDGDDHVCVQDEVGNSFSIYDRHGQRTGHFEFVQYIPVGCFSEGLLPVIKDPLFTYGNGKTAIDWSKPITYLNKKGEEQFTIPGSKHTTSERHELDFSFHEGYTIFTTGESHYGIANNKGEIIAQPDYETLGYVGNGFFVAGKDFQLGRGYKQGIVKADGTEVIPFGYDLDERAVMIYGDNFIVRRNGVELVSQQGEVKNTFASFSTWYPCKDFVDYTNSEKLINAIVELIKELDPDLIPYKVANKAGITPTRDRLYTGSMTLTTTFDDGMQYFKHEYTWDGAIINPNRSSPYGDIVSLSWNVPELEEVKIDCGIDNAVNIKSVYESIVQRLKQEGAVEVEPEGRWDVLPQLAIHGVKLEFRLIEPANELKIFCTLPEPGC